MTITTLSRAQCGLAAPHGATPLHLPRVGITFHRSGGKSLGNENFGEWWRNIQRYHQDVRGYSDVAYNRGITETGVVLEGRSLDVQGAHASSDGQVANRTHWGVCLLGGEGEWGDVTAGTFEAMKFVIFTLQLEANKRGATKPLEIRDHKSWMQEGGTATSCPGDFMRIAVNYFRARAGQPPLKN